MDDQGEGCGRLEPVVIALAARARRPGEGVVNEGEDHTSMKEGQEDPFPEDEEREVHMLLPWNIYLRDFILEVFPLFQFMVEDIPF